MYAYKHFFPLSLILCCKCGTQAFSQFSHVFGRRDELFKNVDDDDDNSRVQVWRICYQ